MTLPPWPIPWAALVLIVAIGSNTGCNTEDTSDPSDTTDASDPSDTTNASDPSDTTDASDPSDTTDEPDPVDVDASLVEIELQQADASGLIRAVIAVSLSGRESEGVQGASVTYEVTPTTGLVLLPSPVTDSSGTSVTEGLFLESGSYTITAVVELDEVSYRLTTQPSVEVDAATCSSSVDYFRTRLWGPVIQQCASCHNPMGRSPEINPGVMTFPFEGTSDYIEQSHYALATNGYPFQLDDGTVLPHFLAKPLGNNHGGGVIIEPDSEEVQLLMGFSKLLAFEAVAGDCVSDETDLFEGIILDDELSTLAHATSTLTGKPMSPDDVERWQDNPNLDAAIDALMGSAHREGFGNRIKELFNDILLVRKFAGGSKTGALQLRPYHKWYFHPCAEGKTKNCCQVDAGECCENDHPDDDEFCTKGEEFISHSAVESTLEMIRYIVENDLPFSDILMLERPVVNPYLAAIYGVEADFEDPRDENEWRLANGPAANTRDEEVEHSGIMSNAVLMARYPSSSSNVNRARSRLILNAMLGIDIMGLAKFEAKLGDELPDNPTYNANGCAPCHALLDPIAAGFKDWRGKGNYRPNRSWDSCNEDNPEELCYRDLGFAHTSGPSQEDQAVNQLRWLGEQITSDPRFAFGIAKLMHTALVRDIVMTPPQNLNRPDYSAHRRAYEAQVAEFQRLAEIFRNSDYQLKTLLKAIIMGPYYRAVSVETADQAQLDALTYARVGRAVPLTPEQLSRRIETTLGYKWTDTLRYTGKSLLDDERWHLIIYGGIDSDDITQRSLEPSAAMQNIARNMSAEMACISVALDFSYEDPTQRKLFRLIEPATVPGNEEDDAKIRETIRYLHLRLLGEVLPDDSEEVDATLELFESAMAAGLAVSENPGQRLDALCEARRTWVGRTNFNNVDGRSHVSTDDYGTINGWIAVITYLLSDYEFLYE